MSEFVPLTRFSTRHAGAPWALRRKEIVPASPERVWRALTDPGELASWWCDLATVDPRPGGRYEFAGPHVYGSGAGSTALAPGGTISVFEPGERLEFTWSLLGVETRVRYELTNQLEMTELVATQEADRAPGWDPRGWTPSWWALALPALRSFVERGKPDLRLDYTTLADRHGIVIEVHASTFPWLIWHKLTSPGEIIRWWGEDAELDLQVGGAFRLRLGGLATPQAETIGPRMVLAVEPESRFEHDWVWPNGERSRIAWRIEETGEDTLLSILDSGPWDPALPMDAYWIFWAATLLDLKQLSERGVTPKEYQS